MKTSSTIAQTLQRVSLIHPDLQTIAEQQLDWFDDVIDLTSWIAFWNAIAANDDETAAAISEIPRDVCELLMQARGKRACFGCAQIGACVEATQTATTTNGATIDLCDQCVADQMTVDLV